MVRQPGETPKGRAGWQNQEETTRKSQHLRLERWAQFVVWLATVQHRIISWNGNYYDESILRARIVCGIRVGATVLSTR